MPTVQTRAVLCEIFHNLSTLTLLNLKILSRTEITMESVKDSDLLDVYGAHFLAQH